MARIDWPALTSRFCTIGSTTLSCINGTKRVRNFDVFTCHVSAWQGTHGPLKLTEPSLFHRRYHACIYFRLDSIVFSMISASTLIMNIGCDEGIFASDVTSFGVFTQHHGSCIVGLFTASAEWLEIKQTDQDNVQPFTIPEVKYHGGHGSDRKY